MKNQTFSAWGIIIFLLTFAMLIGSVFGYWIAEAKLSDETLEIVDDLRWKHEFGTLICGDNMTINPIFVDDRWTDSFLSIKVEGDRLIIETQDGKWFIEMERMEE